MKLCRSCSLAILDVNILKLVHTVATHRHLGTSLVSQELLITALMLCFVWLRGDTNALERLWPGHLTVKWVVVRLSKAIERMIFHNDRPILDRLATIVRPVARKRRDSIRISEVIYYLIIILVATALTSNFSLGKMSASLHLIVSPRGNVISR